MQRVIVFDDGKGMLAPLTDLRPAFDVRTGAMTTLKRWRLTLGTTPAHLRVPESLRAVTRRRSSEPVNMPVSGAQPVLVVNGRCVLPPENLRTLPMGSAIVEAGSGDVICSHVTAQEAEKFLTTGVNTASIAAELPAPSLLSRPWHVRTFRDRAIAMDIQLLATQPRSEDPDAQAQRSALFEVPPEQSRRPQAQRPEPLVIGGGGLTIQKEARVYPGAILDVQDGPIYIAEHAVVRPGAILIGPCYVGHHSIVLERATIRANTAIGPWCKVNGEVGGVIFQGFSNKGHDGYLGDSWIGEWVNLGAGTTNSNLLNTYGEIIARAEPGGKNERTGETFLGAVIGDHVKTAICTRIMTGSIIATGGMFATTAPVAGATRRFAWCTDEGERSYRLDKFIEVARAMMARRKVEPSAAYLERIEALWRAGAVPA